MLIYAYIILLFYIGILILDYFVITGVVKLKGSAGMVALLIFSFMLFGSMVRKFSLFWTHVATALILAILILYTLILKFKKEDVL